jgi:RHS repeat-associated protein
MSAGVNPLFTGKERDAESGLDYFGARYFGSAMGRWTGADAPFADQKPMIPQSWNLYAYVRNNPLTFIDVSGRCSAPVGIKPGQIGVCIASFIETKRFATIGFGNNRGPVGDDPEAGFKMQNQLVIDPSKGSIVSNKPLPGKSPVFFESWAIPGTVSSNSSTPTKDKVGTLHFNVRTSGTNGFGESFFPSIDMSMNLAVTKDGKVGIDGGKRDGYPSLEVYVYDSKGKHRQVLYIKERKPEDLKDPMEQTIPYVAPVAP